MSAPRTLLVLFCLGLAALAPAPCAAEDEPTPAGAAPLATTRSADEAIEQEAASAKVARTVAPQGAAAEAPKGPVPGQTGLSTTGLPGQKPVPQQGRPAGGKTIYGEIIVHK
jgi:hypothetical protein